MKSVQICIKNITVVKSARKLFLIAKFIKLTLNVLTLIVTFKTGVVESGIHPLAVSTGTLHQGNFS
jgi:hypothetical protein